MAEEFEQFKLVQRWFEGAYTTQLKTLLPKGMAWVFNRAIFTSVIQDVVVGEVLQDTTDSVNVIQDVTTSAASGDLLTRLLSCFASELARLEAEGWRLVNETDPGVATDTLEDWEKLLGLPEKCFNAQQLSIAERQRQAHAKLYDTFKITNETFYIEYALSLGFVITIESMPVSTSPRRMGVARMGVQRMGGSGGWSIMEVTVVEGLSDIGLLQCAFDKVKQAHVIIVWKEL